MSERGRGRGRGGRGQGYGGGDRGRGGGGGGQLCRSHLRLTGHVLTVILTQGRPSRVNLHKWRFEAVAIVVVAIVVVAATAFAVVASLMIAAPVVAALVGTYLILLSTEMMDMPVLILWLSFLQSENLSRECHTNRRPCHHSCGRCFGQRDCRKNVQVSGHNGSKHS